MTSAPPLAGGIIAAGEGSRLRQAGFPVPKPMVRVAGVPLGAAVLLMGVYWLILRAGAV